MAVKPKGETKAAQARYKRFAEEYLIDLNATQAAIRAGYSKRTAKQQACVLLTVPYVQELIAAARKEREARTGITADRVIQEAWDIATADARDLMEYRVGCCRHCWGKDHLYQRTQAEYDAAKDAFEADRRADPKKWAGKRFNPMGGVGYDKKRDPHPTCPACAGEGVGRAVFKDTRTLNDKAARLFAGVEETKEGLKFKTHSREAMVDKLFRHFGLYDDKVTLTMPTVIRRDLTGRKD